MSINTPVAIVAQSCIFPGSLTAQAFWENLHAGKDLLSAPDQRRWRTDPSRAMEKRGWNNRAGYVTGFEQVFDPTVFQLEPGLLEKLDPLFHWVLHTAHQAYSKTKRADQGRLHVLLGNLSLPSEGLAKWTEAVWENNALPHRFNRFMSGLPAHLVGAALGRKADAFSLDAACASSLYALKLGCEKLRTRRADLVLAGAVNRADPLFLHIGFQALQALSPTGESRPFHHRANGLVPAEGAAFVALKRLDDAIDCGDEILAVIHDAGLSNDGRSDGLLVPSGEGQVRALRQAFDRVSISPSDVSYIECHATGTAVGDGREVESLSAVYRDLENPVPIGSHKSNMGHAITAAGMAGLFKILGAMRNEVLPPTLHVDETSEIDALKNTPFRVVKKNEPWRAERRIASLSAFGFGGNNSHLLVEQWKGVRSLFPAADLAPRPASQVVVVGCGLVSPFAKDLVSFQKALLEQSHTPAALEELELPIEGLRFPPRDLKESLPQQLAMLRAAIDAVEQTDSSTLARETTGVFVGMQTDCAIVRHGLRARRHDDPHRDDIAAPLTSACVVGSLPNIVANRLNSHFDLGGSSFVTSAEEHSGDVALREAHEAIASGRLSAALVGAVEIGTPQANQKASEEAQSDVAICLLLKERSLAEASGDTILATLETTAELDADTPATTIKTPVAHSATGLLQIAAALALPDFALPRTSAPAGLKREITLATDALFSPRRTTTLRRTPQPVFLDRPRVEVLEQNGQKAAVVFSSDEELASKRARFQAYLSNNSPCGEGLYPFTEPLGGQTAQVFTGAAAAYHGMGKALMLAFPELLEDLGARFQTLDVATRWMTHPDPQTRPTPLDKLFASSVLSQLHNDLTTRLLNIPFDAAIGFSSGETNALFATGVWRDFDGLLQEFTDSQAFTRHLGGDFEALNEPWKKYLAPSESPRWQSWRVVGDRQQLEQALTQEPLVSLILINAPDDVSIGGHAPAIERLLGRLPDHRASHLDYDIAVHIPELSAFKDAWLELHTRKTHPTDRRLYSHAFLDSYTPTQQSVAQALYGQAIAPVDFPALITKAFDDGVRTFVEHGPRTTLGPWIGQILGSRPHQVVSLDTGSTTSLRPLANAIAQLVAAQVPVDLDAFNTRISPPGPPPETPARTLRFNTQTAPIKVTPMAPKTTILPPPPALPRIQQIQPSDRVPGTTSGRVPGTTSGAPETSPDTTSELPEFFQLQQRAFYSYMNVVQAQSAVHQRFLDHTRTAWELFQNGDAAAPVFSPVPPVQPAPLSTAPAPAPNALPGPKFSRADLEHLASHKISDVFGPLFAIQDDFPRQVRMPEPPLLLADRVTGIDAEPGVVATGTIYTETDITPDAWYLHNGHIPPGVMIEAGQADLLLISWMGADFENRGERIYRLLGCELTYQGGLPKAGDTLSYDIHIDDHARQGPVRLFFFHYDCRVDDQVRLSVRNGQAGFFNDEELKNSAGVLWSAETADYNKEGRLDPPKVAADQVPGTLSAEAIGAFAAGDIAACFNQGYERLFTHTRTPNIHHDKMCLIGDIQALEPTGGPWKRGYLRSEYTLTPESWFFEGHFKNDPCMPGTLMFEGGLQAMSFFMIACGLTLDKDGWRFEPVPDVPYQLRCRGQATPQSRKLVYEIFVEELIDDDQPVLVADILATVDGLKAFHCRAMRMQLVPDTPLTETLLTQGIPARDERAATTGGVLHDKLAILATGNGPASMCLGPRYAAFDGHRHIPRLPGEPFQFMTRVTESSAEPGLAREGATVFVEYDIPETAWYFDENDRPTMPFAVLLEAALQPCGWLSLNTSAILDSADALYYRNLDGTATLTAELYPTSNTLTTRTTLTHQSRSAGMVIQRFDVSCSLGDTEIFTMETTFGFFPAKALRNQVGLTKTETELARIAAPKDQPLDLRTPPGGAPASLWPDPMLRMIDRISSLTGSGDTLQVRAEKDVDPKEWFFKAHFFQDPVQPGSLGLEAMLQTLRFALLHEGHHQRFTDPVIEPIALGEALTWSYRGQVIPENEMITILLDVEEITVTDEHTVARATASLWVDGLKIYATKNLALRIREQRRDLR